MSKDNIFSHEINSYKVQMKNNVFRTGHREITRKSIFDKITTHYAKMVFNTISNEVDQFSYAAATSPSNYFKSDDNTIIHQSKRYDGGVNNDNDNNELDNLNSIIMTAMDSKFNNGNSPKYGEQLKLLKFILVTEKFGENVFQKNQIIFMDDTYTLEERLALSFINYNQVFPSKKKKLKSIPLENNEYNLIRE
ncbi:unnamed protein product [Cunninghamella echinulata]